MSNSKTPQTINAELLPRYFEDIEFRLKQNSPEIILGEILRLGVCNTEQIVGAVETLLDLLKFFLKNPEQTLVKISADKVLNEFSIKIYYEDSKYPLGEYEVRTINVVPSTKSTAYLTQEATVRVGEFMFFTQLTESLFEETDKEMDNILAERAKTLKMSSDEYSEAYYGHVIERQTSKVKIERGRKDSEKPCVISVCGRKSVFEPGTKEYGLLKSILVNSRTLKRGAYVDDVGDELYDTTGGYAKNKRLIADTLRNINEKIRLDTGLLYNLIERKGSSFILNKKITLQ